MTKQTIHTGLFERMTIAPAIARLRWPALLAGCLLLAVLIGVTFGGLRKTLADLSANPNVATTAPMDIVPADPLGTGVGWSPRTGDGSN